MEWINKIFRTGAAKTVAIYISIIVASVSITATIIWNVAIYYNSGENEKTEQAKFNALINQKIDIITGKVDGLSGDITGLKSLKDSFKTLNSNIGILARSYERHIMRDEKQTNILIQEIKNISPLLGEKKNELPIPYQLME